MLTFHIKRWSLCFEKKLNHRYLSTLTSISHVGLLRFDKKLNHVHVSTLTQHQTLVTCILKWKWGRKMKSPLLGILIFRWPFSNLSFHRRCIGVAGYGKIHFWAFFESRLASCINIGVGLQATAACNATTRHHKPRNQDITNLGIRTSTLTPHQFNHVKSMMHRILDCHTEGCGFNLTLEGLICKFNRWNCYFNSSKMLKLYWKVTLNPKRYASTLTVK